MFHFKTFNKFPRTSLKYEIFINFLGLIFNYLKKSLAFVQKNLRPFFKHSFRFSNCMFIILVSLWA